MHHPRRQSIACQTQHHVERKKTAASATRHQVVPAIGHLAVKGLQSSLGIIVAGSILAVFEERPQIQAPITCGQEQPDQANAQDRDADEQLLLEFPKWRIATLAKIRNVIKGGFCIGANGHARRWTINPRLLTLNLHGADSEPLLANGKDMLHTLFQL